MASYPSNARLLVVAEDPNLVNNIRKRITNDSYEIVASMINVNSTLKYLEENSDIDCLIIDIVLQGKFDGIELAALVRSKFKLPVIFVTSITEKAFVERAKVIEPSAYILKPFDHRQLNIAIEMALPTQRPEFDPKQQKIAISNLAD
ncbi:MAG: response regulator, partial [Bacteroidota bacterium]